MMRRLFLLAVLLCPLALQAQTGGQIDELSQRVLEGIKQSGTKYTSVCGTVTETRTSKLMTKPLALHGKFCSAGPDRFLIDYATPSPMKIVFNHSTLNLTGADGKTQVMDVGGQVRRGEAVWTGEDSLRNMEKNFTLSTQEGPREYEMRLVPRSAGFKRRLNFLVVKLNKQDFLPRSLEVDGRSGVNSVFVFEIVSTNKPLPEDTFKVETR